MKLASVAAFATMVVALFVLWQADPDYREYMLRTKRLLPGLW